MKRRKRITRYSPTAHICRTLLCADTTMLQYTLHLSEVAQPNLQTCDVIILVSCWYWNGYKQYYYTGGYGDFIFDNFQVKEVA